MNLSGDMETGPADCTCPDPKEWHKPEMRLLCRAHPSCACGCHRMAHANCGIGECVSDNGKCHGCPEYRPAQRKRYAEIGDSQVDTWTLESLREQYRELRTHHVEETTALYDVIAWGREAAIESVVASRGVRHREDWCDTCRGLGVRFYSNTSTWRGGMGGAAITNGICDKCWGSGDKTRPWQNLRTIDEDVRRRVAEQALDALSRSVGAGTYATATHVREIIAHLDKMTRMRKLTVWTQDLANALANTLRRAIGDAEKKL